MTSLLLSGRSDRPTAQAWERRVLRASRGLVVLALLSGIASLAHQAALASGHPRAILERDVVARVLLETKAGHVWLTRVGLLALLAAFLAVTPALLSRADWIVMRGEVAILALLALGLLAAAGHAAAVEPWTTAAVASDAVHLIATGVWLGGLLPLALLLRLASREAGADARPYAVLAARRFSRVALIAVLALIATGIVNTVVQVGSVAALVGTPYGRLLLAKLGIFILILALARTSRWRHLPRLGGQAETVGRPAMRALARGVAGETALGLVLLGLVAAMTLSPPALHLQPAWPFAERLSTSALQSAPALRPRVFVGGQVAILGAVSFASFLCEGAATDWSA
ncbi:MAG: CopD family protein, partial [Candidatus Rokubacteria bacterium]|nr:CopD family protein [Candidatus Rokubacteria bacterium]